MKNTTATITIHDDATASAYYPEYEQAANGAMDYSVTIEIGEITIEGEVTYYGDSQSVESGTPIDVWCSGPVVEWLRSLDERSYGRAVTSLRGGVGTEEIEVAS